MSEQGSESGRGPLRRLSAGRTPTWVKLFGLAAVAVIVLFFALHFAGLAPVSHQI